MGYYTMDGDILRTRTVTMGDGGVLIINKNGNINRDTLILKDKYNWGSIYVKKEVPNDLIKGWIPDW